jgi:hypothetical protein
MRRQIILQRDERTQHLAALHVHQERIDLAPGDLSAMRLARAPSPQAMGWACN